MFAYAASCMEHPVLAVQYILGTSEIIYSPRYPIRVRAPCLDITLVMNHRSTARQSLVKVCAGFSLIVLS